MNSTWSDDRRLLQPGLRRFASRLVLFLPLVAQATDPNDFAPSPGARWHDQFCTTGRETVLTGNFAGDRRDDLVAFEGGHVWVLVASAQAPRFEGPVDWNRYPLPPGAIPVAGDVDGDGLDDLVYFLRNSVEGDAAGDVWAIFTSRQGFETRVKLHDWFCVGDEIPALGDVDGDHRADLITFVPGGAGAVWVSRSNGRAPASESRVWAYGFLTAAGQEPAVADFDGNGRADIAVFVRDTDPATAGQVFVALAQDGAFGPKMRAHEQFGGGRRRFAVGDVNGDGRADLLAFLRGRPEPAPGGDRTVGDVLVALAGPRTGDGMAFGPALRRHDYFCVGEEEPVVGDFNGDGRTDVGTLVRNTLPASSPLHGDVRVALSSFGPLSTWTAHLDRIKVTQATEISGDDPYFILYGFRVRANDPASARVWRANFRAAEWPEDLDTNEEAAIPEAMGTLPLPNVAALTVGDLEAGRLPELVGFFIVCRESDSTSWNTVVSEADRARENMQEQLAAGTRDHPIRPDSRWADLKDWVESTMRGIQLAPIGEGYHPGTGLFDPLLDPADEDETYAVLRFFYPTVDPEVLPRLNLGAVMDFGTRTLTEQQWLLAGRPLLIPCRNEGRWSLQFRLRRGDAAAP